MMYNTGNNKFNAFYVFVFSISVKLCTYLYTTVLL